MARVEGIVFKVYDKTFSGRLTYSIKLDGQPLYYRCGGNRYAGIAEPGNRIAFDAEPNPDGSSGKVTSTPVLMAQQAAPAVASAPSMGGGYNSSERNNSIAYQSARKDALTFLNLVNASGALKLPAAQAAKLSALELALDRYTALFFDDIGTLGAVVREAETATKPADAPAAAESEDE
mgnify:CR=1 FL=1